MTLSDYENGQADFAKKEDKRTVKLGEFRARVIGSIIKNDNLTLQSRVS